MKLSYVAELIAELAVGMLLVRSVYDALGYGVEVGPNVYILRDYLVVFGPVFLAGVSVAGGVGLALESVRGRSPDRWGAGRCMWSIAALYTLAIGIRGVAQTKVVHGASSIRDFVEWFFEVQNLRLCWSDLALMLVASWLAARLARLPRAARPDAREWSGRILAGAIIVQSLIEMASRRFLEI